MDNFLSIELKNFILDYIQKDTTKKTPSDIEKIIKKYFKVTRTETKNYIQSLILSGDLEYTNQFGRTFIDLSFNKPVRVSDHVILKPANRKYQTDPSDIVVDLHRGLSFGIGSHPTTRLSIKGIDFILHKTEKTILSQQKALDIGSGSGVLAITAAMFGVGCVHACDIDSVAMDESQKNALLNNVEKTVIVKNQIDASQPYDYILANLRFPTLIDLYPIFLNLTSSQSYIVLSGIKTGEKEIIEKKYSQLNTFKKIWEKSDTGWVGMVFQRQF